MSDLITLLQTVQNGGGMLAVFVWMVFEVRSLRRDMSRHEKIFHGIE